MRHTINLDRTTGLKARTTAEWAGTDGNLTHCVQNTSTTFRLATKCIVFQRPQTETRDNLHSVGRSSVGRAGQAFCHLKATEHNRLPQHFNNSTTCPFIRKDRGIKE